MNFQFYMPTKCLFGAGQLETLHTQTLPGKSALIVISSGTSVKKFGYLTRLTKELDLASITYTIFDKILPNPIEAHVMEGATLAKEGNYDFVIGLGGGSVIDSAKAIAVMATNPGTLWDYIGGGSGLGKAPVAKALPIVAITTTAGTGTEADPWSVITKSDTCEKIGFGYDDTFPTLSIVDPTLMVSVPANLTAYQGFDALFHSTEGYINKNTNPINDIIGLKAIELVGKYLPTAIKDGNNLEARENIALANTLSGMSESLSGCTSEHSMEHALSGYKPALEHGAGLIMLCQAYYTYWAEKGVCEQRLIDMAKALGKTNATTGMDFVTALYDLMVACNVTELKMSDYDIAESELEGFTKAAYATMGGLFECDPAPMPFEDCLAIYKKSFR